MEFKGNYLVVIVQIVFWRLKNTIYCLNDEQYVGPHYIEDIIMIKNIFTLTMLLIALLNPIFASQVFAKSTQHQQPSLQTALADKSILLAIHQTATDYIAVGEHGIILNTSPQNNSLQQTWQQQNVPVNVTLTAITQLDDGTLLAVGQEGIILQKPPAQEWQVVFSGYQLIDLKKQSTEKQITALEKLIDNTPDEDERDEFLMQLEDLMFAIDDLDTEVDSGPTSPLLDIIALDNGRALAVGAYNSLLLTEDAGKSWKLVNDRLTNPDGFHLNNIVKSKQAIFIFGEAGSAYRSLDNGETFEQLSVPYAGTLFGGEIFNNSNFVIAYGLKGNIIVSRDNGASWLHQQTESSATLLGSTIDNNGDAWLVGHAGTIVKVSANDFSMQSFKHPSGDIFSDLATNQGLITLVGQHGAIVWQVKL